MGTASVDSKRVRTDSKRMVFACLLIGDTLDNSVPARIHVEGAQVGGKMIHAQFGSSWSQAIIVNKDFQRQACWCRSNSRYRVGNARLDGQCLRQSGSAYALTDEGNLHLVWAWWDRCVTGYRTERETTQQL